MNDFIRKVKYYETDKMGITHHSNYIRWMEEARVFFLDEIGYGLKKLEAEGVGSPVVGLECQYKHPSTFDDEIKIDITIEKYTGVKIVFSYVMTNTETDKIVFTAKSTHCFTKENGRPIALKKQFPKLDVILSELKQ